MYKETRDGFTLVEVLVVVSIIGLLSSVVLASINNVYDQADTASFIVFDNSLRAQLGDQMVAEYLFDNQGNRGADTFGDNTATHENVEFESGPVESAPLFDGGGSDRVTLSSAIEFSGDFTVSFWIYVTEFYTNGSYRTVLGGPSNDRLYVTKGAPARLGIRISDANRFTTGNVLRLETWHFIVVTREDDDVSVYVDGEYQGQKYLPWDFIFNAIGHGGSANHFHGKIDAVRFYTKAADL